MLWRLRHLTFRPPSPLRRQRRLERSARDDTQDIANDALTNIGNAESSAVAVVGAAQTTAENSLNAILAAAKVMIVQDHAPLAGEGEDGWLALDTSETRIGV